MGLISSVAMASYKDAFFELHGRFPHLHENHGWIKIEGGIKSYRPSQLLNMADGLRRQSRVHKVDEPNRIIAEMAEPYRRKLKEYKITMPARKDTDVWDVSDEVKKALIKGDKLTIRPAKWKSYIRKDTIILFLNRVYEKFSFSHFDMDRAMAHFISTGEFPNDDNWEKETLEEMNAEILSLRRRLEHKEANIESTIRQKNLYREKVSIANDEIKSLRSFINQQERDMKELKKNSVVFSLDFMEDTPKAKAETWLSNEDDIPF